MKVLVVDGYKATSVTFKRILMRQGFEVDEAENGKAAFEKIRNCKYDVLVVSLEQPDVLGKDLLFFARTNLPSAAMIVTLGSSSLKENIDTLEFGADAVLTKPIMPRELIAIVEKLARK